MILNLLLGYLLFLLIISYNKYQTHPVVIAWCVNLIVYDFLFVNINRIYKNKNITAGKDHIQLFCIRYTNSVLKSNHLVGLNTSFAIIGYCFINILIL